MPSKLIAISVFNNEIEAELAKARLEASGITAFVFKDDCGGMKPHLQLTRGIQLLVSQEGAEIAREILASSESEEGHCVKGG
jgi:hypothetical protein